jgi:hypothetical protein
MILEQDIIPSGLVTIVHSNAAGEILSKQTVKNLVVTSGKQFIAAKMIATTNSPVSMTHMAIGTGSTSPTAADTQLGQEGARVSLTPSTSTNTVTFTATFPANSGTGAVTEAGVFNNSTGGTMLCRTVFPQVNKQAGDTIAITWVVTVS